MRLFGTFPREKMDELVLAGLLLAGIVVAALPESGSARFVRDLVAWGNRSVLSTFDWAFELNYLARDNRDLRRRVAELSLEVRDLSDAALQNQRLRELLDFESGHQNEILLGAEIVGWGDGRQTFTITIAAGLREGVERNMAVVTASGLVGRVDRVPGAHSSVVSLLSDPVNAVAVVVERTREHGIFQYIEGTPRLLDLLASSEVHAGDRLISSGLGGVYPGGIIVGTVLQVENDPDGVTKRVLVKTAAELDKLEEVFILERRP